MPYGPEENPNPFVGPYAPEYYDAADELAGDPIAMALLRAGFSPPEKVEPRVQRPQDVGVGPFRLRGDVVDDVIRPLAGQSLRSQFGRPRRGGESFGVGLAQGFMNSRMQDEVRRSGFNTQEAARVSEANEASAKRVLTAREAAIRLAQARGEKRRAKEDEPRLPITSSMALPLGIRERIGEQVPESEWTKLAAAAEKARRLGKEPKPEPGAPTLTRARFLSLQGKAATLRRRIQQMESKTIDPAADYDGTKRERLANDLEGAQAQLEGVEAELASAPAEWMRGAAPKPAAPAAPVAPAKASRIRVIGPNGETGTMPSDSTLPPGWKKDE